MAIYPPAVYFLTAMKSLSIELSEKYYGQYPTSGRGAGPKIVFDLLGRLITVDLSLSLSTTQQSVAASPG